MEAAFGYFISSPSPYSLELRLIYLARRSVNRIWNLTSRSLWLSPPQLLVLVLFNMAEGSTEQTLIGGPLEVQTSVSKVYMMCTHSLRQ